MRIVVIFLEMKVRATDYPRVVLPVVSDEDGWVEVPWSLGNGTVGDQFALQFFFVNTPECPGDTTWSSSNAIEVTVQ